MGTLYTSEKMREKRIFRGKEDDEESTKIVRRKQDDEKKIIW